MNYNIYIFAGLIIVPIAILFAYYYDYKQDKTEFIGSLKTVGKGLMKGLILIIIIGCLNLIYVNVIPFNKKHGIEFNPERLTLGIPQITKNLKVIPEWSEQYKTVWYDDNSKNGHFKKVVDYGIFSANSETDYFENENKKFTYVSCKYDFEKKTFEYFIEKQAETTNINKTEFEKFIAE